MTGKEFLNSLANGQSDIVQILLDIIAETASPYCVIGGLAVNAYVEPVVSLYIDIVIALKHVDATRRAKGSRRYSAYHRNISATQGEASYNPARVIREGLVSESKPIVS